MGFSLQQTAARLTRTPRAMDILPFWDALLNCSPIGKFGLFKMPILFWYEPITKHTPGIAYSAGIRMIVSGCSTYRNPRGSHLRDGVWSLQHVPSVHDIVLLDRSSVIGRLHLKRV